ncbi:MAG: J domain-containing protein, partial [Actinomycetota bacterium]
MSADPFRTLGLPADASADDVRRVRRELAKRAHPDVGGVAEEMRIINDAAAAALRSIEAAESAPAAPGGAATGADGEADSASSG